MELERLYLSVSLLFPRSHSREKEVALVPWVWRCRLSKAPHFLTASSRLDILPVTVYRAKPGPVYKLQGESQGIFRDIACQTGIPIYPSSLRFLPPPPKSHSISLDRQIILGKISRQSYFCFFNLFLFTKNWTFYWTY